LDAAEALLRSVFCEAFTRGTRGSALKVTPFGSIPRNWEVLPLGEAYEVQLGKKLYREFTEGDGQVPYLRNANVQWNRLDLSDVATMTFSCKERDLYELRYGDILACEGRHVGKAAMWRDEVPGACYQMALHRLRRRSPRHAPGYLLHCLRYYSISGRFRAVTGETTIPHLPAEAFKRMLFPFPPTDEQEEIANLIDGVYASIESANARLKSTQALLRGLLQVLHPGGQ
jgi:type I restriction enzyme S subunit